MTRERLIDLMDLTLAVSHLIEVNDMHYNIELQIGTIETNIWVHDLKNNTYISYSTYGLRDDKHHMFDPDLIRGEEHIRRIMEGEHDAR